MLFKFQVAEPLELIPICLAVLLGQLKEHYSKVESNPKTMSHIENNHET